MDQARPTRCRVALSWRTSREPQHNPVTSEGYPMLDRVCSKCGKAWGSDFNFCPRDGATLVASAEPEPAPVAVKPAVSALASKPAVSAVVAKPAVSALAAKPAVSAVASKPAVSAVASKPAVSAVASKPAVSAVASSPVASAPSSFKPTRLVPQGARPAPERGKGSTARQARPGQGARVVAASPPSAIVTRHEEAVAGLPVQARKAHHTWTFDKRPTSALEPVADLAPKTKGPPTQRVRKIASKPVVAPVTPVAEAPRELAPRMPAEAKPVRLTSERERGSSAVRDAVRALEPKVVVAPEIVEAPAEPSIVIAPELFEEPIVAAVAVAPPPLPEASHDEPLAPQRRAPAEIARGGARVNVRTTVTALSAAPVLEVPREVRAVAEVHVHAGEVGGDHDVEPVPARRATGGFSDTAWFKRPLELGAVDPETGAVSFTASTYVRDPALPRTVRRRFSLRKAVELSA